MNRSYCPPAGYVTMRQAQERLGIAKATLQRMVRAGTLATYADRRNSRVTLLKEDDIEQLMHPVPMGKAAA